MSKAYKLFRHVLNENFLKPFEYFSTGRRRIKKLDSSSSLPETSTLHVQMIDSFPKVEIKLPKRERNPNSFLLKFMIKIKN